MRIFSSRLVACSASFVGLDPRQVLALSAALHKLSFFDHITADCL